MNNYAVSSDGIATALKNSASALMSANNSYEEAVAMVAAGNRVVQDPSSLGSGLRTIALRLRGTSVDGEDDEGLITSKSKLQSQIKSLSGVDILTDTGAYKSTYEILLDISKVWEDMSDIDQAALLEIIAGKNRSNVAASLLSNTQDLEKAYKSALDAEGSALQENEKYLDSIQGKMDLFTNAVQTMWKNTISSKTVKDIVSIGTILIKLISGFDVLGVKISGLIPTVVVLGAVITKIKKKMTWGEFFGSIGTSITALNTKLTEIATRLGILRTTATTTKTAMNGVTTEMFQQSLAAVGVSVSDQELIASKMKLIATNNSALVGTKTLAIATLQEAVANKTLTSTQAVLAAQKLGLLTITKGLNVASANTILKLGGLDIQQRKNVISSLLLSQKTKALTKTEIINALAKQGIVDAAKQEEIANNILLISRGKLMFSLKTLGAGIKKFIAQNSLVLTIAAAAAAIWAVVKAFDGMIVTLKESDEKLTELNSALEATESKLSDLEGQLKEVQDRMKELNEQPSLTFAEQEELNKLREQSNELERQLDLTNQIKKGQQRSVNNQAMQTARQYEDANFKSGKGKEDQMETGATIGAVAGGIIGGILAVALAPVTGGLSILVGAGGAAAGGLVGGGIGTGVGAAVAEGQTQVDDAMEDMLEQRRKLEEEYNKAHEAYANNPTKKKVVKEYEEAEGALANYDSMMSEHLAKLDSYYSQIDLSVYDPVLDKQKIEDLRKEMNDFYDTQDKWAIENGGVDAKSNAIARIFGDEAQGNIAKARDEIKTLKKNLTEAKKSGEGVDDALAALKGFKLNLSEEETQRLRDMGIYLYEVEDYFKNVVEAESEFIDNDLENVANDINKIADGLDSLKSAFDEVIEDGVLTAKTILSIKEALGIGTDDTKELTSAWKEYLEIMMSGTATTEEIVAAIEKLTQAWIEDALVNNNLTPEVKMEFVAQLKSLGVDNAAEYVEDLLQKDMTKELESAFEVARGDVKKEFVRRNRGAADEFDSYTDEQVQELAVQYNLYGRVSEESIQKIIDKYGVEEDAVQGIIDKLEEKAALENQIAKEQQKQSEYNEWYNGENGFGALSQDIQQYQKIIDEYDNFSEKVKNFNKKDWIVYKSSAGSSAINHNTNKSMTIDEYNQLVTEREQYDRWLKQNAEKYNEYIQLKTQYDAALQKGMSNGWVDKNGNIIKDDFAQNISNLKNQIDEIEKEIDEEYTIDVRLKLDLINLDEEVDKTQSIFDTLSDAQKEYAENGGKVSVDTFQELLKLESKYLTMLYNEQGQIELNKEALLQVAQARLYDMTQKQIDSIITTATNAAKSGEIERLKKLTEVLYNAGEAQEDFNLSAMQGLRIALANTDLGLSATEQGDYYNAVLDQVNATIGAYKKSAGSLTILEDTLSSAGNTATQEVNDAFQDAMDYWENRIGAAESRFEQVQNEIDLLESQGKRASAGYYATQLKELQEFDSEGNLIGGKLYLLNEQLGEAETHLQKIIDNGGEGSEDFWDVANTINDIHNEIDQTTLSIQDLKDAMADTHWYMFDEAQDRVSTLSSDLENIRDILSNEEFFDDEGNFTKEGLGYLATYVNDLGVFEGALAHAKAEMELFGDSYDPNKTYVDAYGNDLSIDSEQDWYDAAEKAEEKYDEWNSKIVETRYNIKDLYEQQIDSVEEYTQTLVENYSEYIDSVKEALDSERDLYEFKKSTEEKSKNIASIERRIASLSGSTNAADIAERRKLQAELMDAKSDMDDHYYSHAKDQQSQALDDESAAYEQTMNAYIDSLRTKLEESTAELYMSYEDMGIETKAFVDGVTEGVILNAGNVKEVYLATGETIDDCLVIPWTKAAAKIGEFASSEGALGLMNSWIVAKEGAPFYDFQTKTSEYLSKPWKTIIAAGGPIQTFKTSINNVMSQIVQSVQTNVSGIDGIISGLQTEINKIKDTTIRITTVYEEQGGGKGPYEPYVPQQYHTTATLDIGTAVLTSKGVGSSKSKAESEALTAMSDSYYNYKISHGAREDAIYGLWSKTKSKIKYNTQYYAKGTAGTSRDEWAITDEPQFGDELVMYATPEGTLSFMRAGSTVVPADITKNLVEWGQFTPDAMNLGGGVNVNMINNAVVKPQYDFSFDSLVHVDHCDQSTVKDLEKMVDSKIDTFARQLNYSIKKFSR